MGNRIIAISREFGSGGRTIGKEVADKLGIPCYDAELIEKIAEESGLAKEYIRINDEHANYGRFVVNNFAAGQTAGSFDLQEHVWAAQRQVIQDIADKESCVIVGRCADYILKDRHDVLKVFIHADIEKRADRVVNVYGESAESPIKRVKEKDKHRKAYHRYFTDTEWGQAQYYDICLDSGKLGIEKCVNVISELY